MHRIVLLCGAAATALAFGLTVPDTAHAKSKHCPPGLAKKNPPCVPPGLAKKGVSPGEYYYDHPHVWLDPDRYQLDSRYGWYKIGDDIMVRTDRKTGEILELMDAIIAVLD